jgi:predicted TIM-barrel fold metal-dependent hydrolase
MFPPETILQAMDAHGVERCILIQGSIYGYFNQPVSAAVNKHPDRFMGCMLVDPKRPDVAAEIRHYIEAGGTKTMEFERSEMTGLSGIYPKLKSASSESEAS